MININQLDLVSRQYENSCLFFNYAICCKYFTNREVDSYFRDYFNEFLDDFHEPSSFFNSPYLDSFLHNSSFKDVFNNGFNKFTSSFLDYIFHNIKLDLFLAQYSMVFVSQLHQRTYKGYIPYGSPQNENLEGYTFLKLLHQHIQQPIFMEAHNIIGLEKLSRKSDGSYQENELNIKSDDEFLEYFQTNEVLINAYKAGHSYTMYGDISTGLLYSHNTEDPTNDRVLETNWLENYNPFLFFFKTT
jgi:hypothetical protein